MNKELFMEGLEFVQQLRLSHREIEVLLRIIREPCTVYKIAEESKKSPGTIHHLLKGLRLRNLIQRFGTDNKRNFLYKFNESVLV